MLLKVLVDNTALDGFEAVHGFSVILKSDKKILFDVGPNDLFLKNGLKLNEDLSDIDTVVLSHGHWDHGDGLKYLHGKKLIMHPDGFTLRYRKHNKTIVGLSASKEELNSQFDVKESKAPYWISDEIVFLGEIPRINDFESKKSSFVFPDGDVDFVKDDSAIAIRSTKGLLVISGCAHSGICNTVSYAKQVCNTDRIYAVLGGFHLKELDEVTTKTIQYLLSEKVELIGATHCTSFKVRDEFKKHFKSIDLAAGAVVEL